jgi:hypothetical protein
VRWFAESFTGSRARERGDDAMDCCGHEGQGSGDARFDIKPVADGVHVAVAAPDY